LKKKKISTTTTDSMGGRKGRGKEKPIHHPCQEEELQLRGKKKRKKRYFCRCHTGRKKKVSPWERGEKESHVSGIVEEKREGKNSEFEKKKEREKDV